MRNRRVFFIIGDPLAAFRVTNNSEIWLCQVKFSRRESEEWKVESGIMERAEARAIPHSKPQNKSLSVAEMGNICFVILSREQSERVEVSPIIVFIEYAAIPRVPRNDNDDKWTAFSFFVTLSIVEGSQSCYEIG